MRVKQSDKEQRTTRPVQTSVRCVAVFCYVCLSALWVIVSGAGVLRICAELRVSDIEQCQFTVCTFVCFNKRLNMGRRADRGTSCTVLRFGTSSGPCFICFLNYLYTSFSFFL